MAQHTKGKNGKLYSRLLLFLLVFGIATTMLYVGGMMRNDSQGTESTPIHAVNRPFTVSEDGNQQNDSAPPDKNTARMLTLPCLTQTAELPTGCEAVSAVMVLQYYGERITPLAFVNGYLDCDTSFYTAADGAWCGPDPYQVFVGDPHTENGYGCYAPVIEKAVAKYFDSTKRVENTTGKSLQTLCAEYLDQGIPVLVWASMEMQATYPSRSWRLESGELFTWLAKEHCLVLIGYDAERYFFNDPRAGAVVGYEKSLVEQRYRELGTQSLVITKEER